MVWVNLNDQLFDSDKVFSFAKEEYNGAFFINIYINTEDHDFARFEIKEERDEAFDMLIETLCD